MLGFACTESDDVTVRDVLMKAGEGMAIHIHWAINYDLVLITGIMKVSGLSF